MGDRNYYHTNSQEQWNGSSNDYGSSTHCVDQQGRGNSNPWNGQRPYQQRPTHGYDQDYQQDYPQQSRHDYYGGNEGHQQSDGYTNNRGYQQQQQYMVIQNRGGGGFPSFNPNATSFVPQNRNQQQRQSAQDFDMATGSSSIPYSSIWSRHDMYPPSYASAPMYGNEQQQPQSCHQDFVHAAPPTMTQFYSDNEADLAAYEAMYNQFGAVPPHAEQYIPSVDLQYKMARSPARSLLEEIQVGIEQLASDTEEFDTWAGAIKDRFSQKLITPEDRHIACQLVTEIAVLMSPSALGGGDTPQLSFARLLGFLVSDCPTLRREGILPVLQHFHGLRSSYDPERKSNLLMYYAEVYDKITTDTGARIDPIGDAVVEQLTDLLKPDAHTSDLVMKGMLQVLKITGPHFDRSEAGKEKMNDVLTRLSGFAKGHPQLNESTRAQINALIEERQKGWGASRSHASSSGSSIPMGTIVGDDGAALELNDEERLFLEAHFGQIDGAPPVSSQRSSNTSLDELEIMNEYGQFVKEQEMEKRRKQDKKTAELFEKLKVDSDKTTTSKQSETPATTEKSE